MKRRDIILILSVSIVAILSLASYYGYNYNDQKIDEERLLIYSGAGLKPVMDEIADKFEEKQI